MFGSQKCSVPHCTVLCAQSATVLSGQSSTRQGSRATIVSVFLLVFCFNVCLHLQNRFAVTRFRRYTRRREKKIPSPFSQHFKTQVYRAPALTSLVLRRQVTHVRTRYMLGASGKWQSCHDSLSGTGRCTLFFSDSART